MGIDLQDQKNFLLDLFARISGLFRKSGSSLNSRLVLSHLAVSLVSIILMGIFTGRYIFQAANFELDAVIDPAATRDWIVAGLEACSPVAGSGGAIDTW